METARRKGISGNVGGLVLLEVASPNARWAGGQAGKRRGL